MLIAVGNGIGDEGSKPKRGCLDVTILVGQGFFYLFIFLLRLPLVSLWAQSARAVKYTDCISVEWYTPQQMSWIWLCIYHDTIWLRGSSLGVLEDVEYLFIAITPRSTLT